MNTDQCHDRLGYALYKSHRIEYTNQTPTQIVATQFQQKLPSRVPIIIQVKQLSWKYDASTK